MLAEVFIVRTALDPNHAQTLDKLVQDFLPLITIPVSSRIAQSIETSAILVWKIVGVFFCV